MNTRLIWVGIDRFDINIAQTRAIIGCAATAIAALTTRFAQIATWNKGV
jgi:hypothetical protein